MTRFKAWRQNRLDLARLMVNKAHPDTVSLDTSSVEELADLFFEIGRCQGEETQWVEALYWLERAHDILRNHSQDLLSSDAGELRIGIMHDMARAFLNRDGEGDHKKAYSIVQELEFCCGNRLVTLLLKLDILAADGSHAAQDYCDNLHKIVRLVHLSDINIKTVLHHVYKLSSRSPFMAHRVLLTLLSERLLGAEETKWTEKTLITIIWNCTTFSNSLDASASLSEVFDVLTNEGIQALSPHATHAAHIVRATQDFWILY